MTNLMNTLNTNMLDLTAHTAATHGVAQFFVATPIAQADTLTSAIDAARIATPDLLVTCKQCHEERAVAACQGVFQVDDAGDLVLYEVVVCERCELRAIACEFDYPTLADYFADVPALAARDLAHGMIDAVECQHITTTYAAIAERLHVPAAA